MVILMLGAQKKMSDQLCKRAALQKGWLDPCKRVFNLFWAVKNVEKKGSAPVDSCRSKFLLAKKYCTGNIENP